MKDLIFLLLTLGFITFAMIAAQGTYRGQEAEKAKEWERQRLSGKGAPTTRATPTPTPAPNR